MVGDHTTTRGSMSLRRILMSSILPATPITRGHASEIQRTATVPVPIRPTEATKLAKAGLVKTSSAQARRLAALSTPEFTGHLLPAQARRVKALQKTVEKYKAVATGHAAVVPKSKVKITKKAARVLGYKEVKDAKGKHVYIVPKATDEHLVIDKSGRVKHSSKYTDKTSIVPEGDVRTWVKNLKKTAPELDKTLGPDYNWGFRVYGNRNRTYTFRSLEELLNTVEHYEPRGSGHKKDLIANLEIVRVKRSMAPEWTSRPHKSYKRSGGSRGPRKRKYVPINKQPSWKRKSIREAWKRKAQKKRAKEATPASPKFSMKSKIVGIDTETGKIRWEEWKLKEN